MLLLSPSYCELDRNGVWIFLNSTGGGLSKKASVKSSVKASVKSTADR